MPPHPFSTPTCSGGSSSNDNHDDGKQEESAVLVVEKQQQDEEEEESAQQKQNLPPLPPQKYSIGKTVIKEFPPYGFYQGTIQDYNNKGEYSIVYEDGDTEKLDQYELDRIFRRMKGGDLIARNQKYALGKTFYKEFDGYKDPFLGTICSYTPKTGLYKISYEDGDQEEMDEFDIDRQLALYGGNSDGGNAHHPPPEKRKIEDQNVSSSATTATVTATTATTTSSSSEVGSDKDDSSPDNNLSPAAAAAGGGSADVATSSDVGKEGDSNNDKPPERQQQKKVGSNLISSDIPAPSPAPAPPPSTPHNAGRRRRNHQKHPLGTTFQKRFDDKDPPLLWGTVIKYYGYSPQTSRYIILYENGDEEEEMDEFDIDRLLLCQGRREKGQNQKQGGGGIIPDHRPQKHKLGTTFFKVFDGYKDPCKGTLTSYEPKTGLYKIRYETEEAEEEDCGNCKDEELDEHDIDRQLAGGNKETLAENKGRCKQQQPHRRRTIAEDVSDDGKEEDEDSSGEEEGGSGSEDAYQPPSSRSNLNNHSPPPSSCRPQKHPLGTTFHKPFLGHKDLFEGTIVKFTSQTGLYQIQYNDGDEEEMDEFELDRVLLQNVRRIAGGHPLFLQKHELGTTFYKEFEGYNDPFEGTIASYEPKTGLYRIIYYQDGDEEELDRFDIDRQIALFGKGEGPLYASTTTTPTGKSKREATSISTSSAPTRRSKRARVSTVITTADGYNIKKTNNYVVKGGSYVYQPTTEVEEDGGRVASWGSNRRRKPKASSSRQRKQKSQPTSLESQQRLQHNARIKAAVNQKEPIRQSFLAKHKDILQPFLEPRVIRKLEHWNTTMNTAPSSATTYIHQEIFVQPDLLSLQEGESMRDYQLVGLNFLVECFSQGLHCILADEMGLGKTLQTIAFLCHLKETDTTNKTNANDKQSIDSGGGNSSSGCSLVVCPLSVIYSWRDEVKKWAPSLKVLLFHSSQGADRNRERAEITNAKYDIIITTYDQVRTKELSNIWSTCQFRVVVLDEGHRIKGQETLVSQAVRKINSEFRLLLTGTPLQNNLVELFSLLSYLHPDIFTSPKEFENAFVIEKSCQNRKRTTIDKDKLHQAQELLGLFMLRRKKDQVEKLLPIKIETKTYVPLSKKQIRLYKSVLMKQIDLLSWGGGDAPEEKLSKAGRAKLLANLHTQLRKLCGHPLLLFQEEDNEGDFSSAAVTNRTAKELIEPSGKFAVLDQLLRSLFQKKHRVVLFSQFTMVLDLIAEYCTKRGWNHCCYDGRTPRAKRNYFVGAFNDPNSSLFLFLMSTRAGNLGLNLQAGSDTVIIFDSDHNPQVDLQAQARVHRVGQTRPVHVYRLICAGTIEERIVQRAEKKLLLDKIVTEDQHQHTSTAAAAAAPAENDDNQTKSADILFDDIKFGSAAVFGDETMNTLPTKKDIDHITDRTRSDRDSHGMLKGNASHSTATFDVNKKLQGAQVYEGIDFQKVREGQERLERQNKPNELRKLECSEEKVEGKRKRKSRITIVNGSISVLNANNYDLEEGESSVFARELASSNHERFAVQKREREVVPDHQQWCQHCGDGGTLLCCERCPVAVHGTCCPTIRRQFPRCFHHWCTVCLKQVVSAGGLLYPCQSCPNSFCENHLPRNEEGFRIIGKCNRFEEIGWDSTKHAIYIHCSKQCEEYAKVVWGWQPNTDTWPLPPEIDVSASFGSPTTTAADSDEPNEVASDSRTLQPSSTTSNPSASASLPTNETGPAASQQQQQQQQSHDSLPITR